MLLIHNHYQLHGGEDAVVAQEMELLKQEHQVEVLFFQNQAGLKGAIQFLSSVWNINAARKVSDKIKEFQPDVVHIHNFHFALGPLIFRQINILGIPIVHTIHNYRLLCPSALLLNKNKLFKRSLKQSFPWSAIKDKVYRSSAMQTFWLAFVIWFHKKIGTWNKIDSYLCLTSFAVKLFEESNFGVSEERFVVKPNFREKPTYKASLKKEQHFLFIGRLSTEKGIEVILDAFKELPFSIKIAGEGPLKYAVEEAAEQFSNITYVGNLTSEKVIQELQKAQALIFPSIWYEGMPMTIIESLSAGTPVIASNLGAMSSMILNDVNGFHFAPDNINSLKASVTKFSLLSNLEKENMGDNAFKSYKEKYSPELQLKYFDTIYNDAINKKLKY